MTTHTPVSQNCIRNFSIIAHIDHGKSTLSDRLIQTCGGLEEREMREQVLDSMEIERERGITIKAQSVTLFYQAKDGLTYQLNFIDTPGHVDFSYEVSRSLAACEGALLVVDAAQGVEAQTVATCYTAVEQGLLVLPVLNKIDLPQADPDRVRQEIEDVIGIDAVDALEVSAKAGIGIADLLERLVANIPAPGGDLHAPLQALIIDSWFDNYLGVVSLVRIKNGCLRKGEKIKVMSSGKEYTADQLGIFTPKRKPLSQLQVGEVGYVVASIKDIFGAPVGDTLTHVKNPCSTPLPGFKQMKPQVYAGFLLERRDEVMSDARSGRLGVGIIGAGRVGPIIGAALAGANHAIVGITAVSEHSRERADTILPGVPILEVPDLVERSELVVLAVPDSELPALIAGLAATASWQAGQLVMHTAPGFGVGILAPALALGAIPLAIHPAMEFTGTTLDLARLHETYFAVTAPAPVLPIAQALVVEMGGEPVVVAEADRAAYAEAISTASAFSRSIVDQATGILAEIGIERPGIFLSSLVRSSVDNALMRAG